MSNRSDRLSVVICAYTEERWQDLIDAVESVQRQSARPDEIIVVIDHNSALLARAHKELSGVIVIENRETRGLSGARNSGIAVARGDVIAFMDEDATAAPDWLARLISAYADPCVLGVGGAIEPDWLAGRPAWFPEEFDWVVGCTYRGMPEVPARVRNLIGCNMSFRCEVLVAATGFRSGIGRVGARPVGCEETELCIRLQQQRPQSILLYEPNARVFHRVPPQRARWRYFFSRCYFEGRSKALVARLVGAQDGLASERSYTLRVLPRGVLRGAADVIRRGDPSGLGRAIAITSGLLLTTLGYLRDSLPTRSVHPRELRTENHLI